MGRAPCCEKVGLNRGAWTREEDLKLIQYITTHGEGSWRTLPKAAGLLRCGKSCRLRWINYLRPDLKRGNITEEEDRLIIKLHSVLGNRWSLIAARLPGRTDNEIKNYWNTHLKKKLKGMGIDPSTHQPLMLMPPTNHSTKLAFPSSSSSSSSSPSSSSSKTSSSLSYADAAAHKPVLNMAGPFVNNRVISVKNEQPVNHTIRANYGVGSPAPNSNPNPNPIPNPAMMIAANEGKEEGNAINAQSMVASRYVSSSNQNSGLDYYKAKPIYFLDSTTLQRLSTPGNLNQNQNQNQNPFGTVGCMPPSPPMSTSTSTSSSSSSSSLYISNDQQQTHHQALASTSINQRINNKHNHSSNNINNGEIGIGHPLHDSCYMDPPPHRASRSSKADDMAVEHNGLSHMSSPRVQADVIHARQHNHEHHAYDGEDNTNGIVLHPHHYDQHHHLRHHQHYIHEEEVDEGDHHPHHSHHHQVHHRHHHYNELLENELIMWELNDVMASSTSSSTSTSTLSSSSPSAASIMDLEDVYMFPHMPNSQPQHDDQMASMLIHTLWGAPGLHDVL